MLVRRASNDGESRLTDPFILTKSATRGSILTPSPRNSLTAGQLRSWNARDRTTEEFARSALVAYARNPPHPRVTIRARARYSGARDCAPSNTDELNLLQTTGPETLILQGSERVRAHLEFWQFSLSKLIPSVPPRGSSRSRSLSGCRCRCRLLLCECALRG